MILVAAIAKILEAAIEYVGGILDEAAAALDNDDVDLMRGQQPAAEFDTSEPLHPAHRLEFDDAHLDTLLGDWSK